MNEREEVRPPHRRLVQDRVPEAAEEGLSPGEGGGEQQRVCRRLRGEEEGFGIGAVGTCGPREHR